MGTGCMFGFNYYHYSSIIDPLGLDPPLPGRRLLIPHPSPHTKPSPQTLKSSPLPSPTILHLGQIPKHSRIHRPRLPLPLVLLHGSSNRRPRRRRRVRVRRPRQRHGACVACGAPAYRVRTFSRNDRGDGGGGVRSSGGGAGEAAGRMGRGGLAHRDGDGSRDDGRLLVAGGRLEGRRRVDAGGAVDEELFGLRVDDVDVCAVDGVAGGGGQSCGEGRKRGEGGRTIGSRTSCRRSRGP